MHKIEIVNAHEGNLRNVSLTLPKEKLIVPTGVLWFRQVDDF